MIFFQRLLITLLLFASVPMLLLVQYELILQANLTGLPDNKIYDPAKGEARPEERELLNSQLEQVRLAIGRAPSNQELLNAYFVLNSKLGNFNLNDRTEFLAHIGRYGWRSTAYLQNKILNGIERADLKSIILVADALLRRAQLVDQSYALLFLAESNGYSRNLLVDRLNLKPDWRSRFFGDAANLAQPQQLDARVITLEKMLMSGFPISRQEIAPTVTALIRSRKLKLAYNIGELVTYNEQKALNNTRNNSGFASFVESDHPMPSEWNSRKGNGYHSGFLKKGGRHYLNIQWDGRGRPVLLQKLLRLDEKQYTVEILGEISPDLIEVSFLCPEGGQAILNYKSAESKLDKYIFRSDSTLRCPFGYFRLTGKGAFGTARQSFQINNIDIR